MASNMTSSGSGVGAVLELDDEVHGKDEKEGLFANRVQKCTWIGQLYIFYVLRVGFNYANKRKVLHL